MVGMGYGRRIPSQHALASDLWRSTVGAYNRVLPLVVVVLTAGCRFVRLCAETKYVRKD